MLLPGPGSERSKCEWLHGRGLSASRRRGALVGSRATRTPVLIPGHVAGFNSAQFAFPFQLIGAKVNASRLIITCSAHFPMLAVRATPDCPVRASPASFRYC